MEETDYKRKPWDFTVTIVSGTVSLPWFRNDGTEKSFTEDIFSLADQNSFAKSFSLF